MNVLVVVDMQKDFIDGALGTQEAQSIVDNVVNRIKNSQNELILFTQDTHGADYLNTPEGQKLPVPHCIKNTPGWEINPQVLQAWESHPNTIKASNHFFEKPVFGSVDLVAFLQCQGPKIDGIEILGVCTDICVISNAIMIKNVIPSIKVSVNQSCCAGVTPQSHAEAINTMVMCQIDVI